MKIDPQYSEKFESRHNSPDQQQIEDMLALIKAKSLDDLISETIPANIRLKNALSLPDAQSEYNFLKTFKTLMS